MKKIFFVFSFLNILFVANAFAQDEAALYKNTCESCHGPKMDGDGPIGKALNPKPSNLSKYTSDQLIQVMKTATKVTGDKKEIPLMLGVKTQLKTDAERKAVANYILSKVGKK